MTKQEAERILELSGSYDEKTLKAHYRRLSRKYHPDDCAKNGLSEAVANAKIREINNAHDVLSKYLNITNERSNQTSSAVEQIKQKLIKELTTLDTFEFQKVLELRSKSEINNLNIDNEILEIYYRYNKLIKDTIMNLRVQSITSQSQMNGVMKKFQEEKESLCKELENLLCDVYLEKYFSQFPDVFHKKIRSEYHQALSNDFFYEVLEKFLEPLRDKDKKKVEFLNAYKEQIARRIALEMIEYSNYAYYEQIKKELEELQKNTIQELHSLLGKISLKKLEQIIQDKIEKLKQKANQLFNDYVTFLNTRQEVVNDLISKIEASNLSDIQKSELIKMAITLVDIENKLEFSEKKLSIIQALTQSNQPRKKTLSGLNNYSFIDDYDLLRRNKIIDDKNYLKLLKNCLSFKDYNKDKEEFIKKTKKNKI